MKKIIVAVVCLLSIAIFSSCRSTSKSCGLANLEFTNQTSVAHVQFI